MELQMVETLPDKDKEGLEVVYQGIEGAYSQIAALTYFGKRLITIMWCDLAMQ